MTLKEWMSYSYETFAGYELPFMIIHGGKDKVIDPKVAFDLYSSAKTPEEDKKIIFY